MIDNYISKLPWWHTVFRIAIVTFHFREKQNLQKLKRYTFFWFDDITVPILLSPWCHYRPLGGDKIIVSANQIPAALLFVNISNAFPWVSKHLLCIHWPFHVAALLFDASHAFKAVSIIDIRPNISNRCRPLIFYQCVYLRLIQAI